MKKESSQSASTGWECRYDGAFRPFIPPTGVSDKIHSKPGKVPVHQKQPIAEPAALSDTDSCSSDKSSVASADSDEQIDGLANVSISDDDRPDDLAFWFSDIESGGRRRSRRKRRPKTKGRLSQ